MEAEDAVRAQGRKLDDAQYLDVCHAKRKRFADDVVIMMYALRERLGLREVHLVVWESFVDDYLSMDRLDAYPGQDTRAQSAGVSSATLKLVGCSPSTLLLLWRRLPGRELVHVRCSLGIGLPHVGAVSAFQTYSDARRRRCTSRGSPETKTGFLTDRGQNSHRVASSTRTVDTEDEGFRGALPSHHGPVVRRRRTRRPTPAHDDRLSRCSRCASPPPPIPARSGVLPPHRPRSR